MRKVKLQMQMTVDGFVAGPNGELDWMSFAMDEPTVARINELIDTSDTIVMGRKMADGFVKYWEGVPPDSPEYPFARKMIDTPKIVFSRTVDHVPGQNLRVENRPPAEVLAELKAQEGKDLLVYGGAGFASSLIEQNLVDELHFFVNPVAIGEGMRVFHGRTPLERIGSTAYEGGKVVNSYKLV